LRLFWSDEMDLKDAPKVRESRIESRRIEANEVKEEKNSKEM